jgi:hypothetical protein
MSSNRSLLVVAAAVVAVAALAIVVVFVSGGRGTASVAPDSPEGILQRYLAAWEDDDLATAHSLFSADVRSQMDLSEFERARDDWATYTEAGDRRVLFDSTRIDGDEATVSVTVEQFSGDGLGGSTYRSARAIRMIREDGAWRIDEPLTWLDPAPILERP